MFAGVEPEGYYGALVAAVVKTFDLRLKIFEFDIYPFSFW